MDSSTDISQLCRLCLLKDKVNTPIFEGQGDIGHVYKKISSLLPVKVAEDDKLPKSICDSCTLKLDMFYEFWQMSGQSEKKLLEWLNETEPNNINQPTETIVKQEAIDINDKLEVFMNVPTYGQDFFEETTTTVDEPQAKRPKRATAAKAAATLHETDDEDDPSETLTKMEDESEGTEGEDQESAIVNVPSTSADSQPGPSGVGKESSEAPCDQDQDRHICDDGLDDKEVFSVNGAEVLARFRCPVCSISFQSSDEYNTHLARNPGCNSGKNSDEFHCDICFDAFNDQISLDKHYQLHGELVSSKEKEKDKKGSKDISTSNVEASGYQLVKTGPRSFILRDYLMANNKIMPALEKPRVSLLKVQPEFPITPIKLPLGKKIDRRFIEINSAQRSLLKKSVANPFIIEPSPVPELRGFLNLKPVSNDVSEYSKEGNKADKQDKGFIVIKASPFSNNGDLNGPEPVKNESLQINEELQVNSDSIVLVNENHFLIAPIDTKKKVPAEKPPKKFAFPKECPECNMKILRFKSYRRHLKRKLSCVKCEFRHCKITELKAHYLLKHDSYLCNKCNAVFDKVDELLSHSVKKHYCRHCSRHFGKSHKCNAAHKTT